MTANGNGNNITAAKRKRLRAVEELYLNGYCALEIHDLIGDQFGVARGTIRNDIVAIRKMWGDDIDHRDQLEGKERYMASLRSVRRKVMGGHQEIQPDGRIRIVGRDYKLAHSIDKEIARLSGVRLVSEEHTVHLTIEKAKAFIEDVMGVVMKHVTDPEVQHKIIAELEQMGTGS